MSEEIKDIFECLKKYANLTPDAIDDLYYLEGTIEDLQQKVEQLEKENIKQKEIIENLTTMTVCGDKKQIKNTAQYKLEQLENIRKEAIEYINNHQLVFRLSSKKQIENWFDEFYKDLLNILNKGE